MIGVYVLSRKWKIGYFHSSILALDSNPGDGLMTEEHVRNYLKVLDSYSQLPGESCIHNHLENEQILMNTVPSKLVKFFLLLVKFRIQSIIRRKPLLVSIGNPFPQVEKNPDIYRAFQRLKATQSSDKYQIHMHLHWAKSNAGIMRARYLDPATFHETLYKIANILNEHKIEFEVYVHTDLVKGNTKWKPAASTNSTFYHQMAKSLELDSSDEYSIPEFNFQAYFEDICPVKVVSNISAVEAWRMIEESNIFIMNNSSFSFVGALVATNALVIYNEFWHKPMDNWVSINDYKAIHEGVARTISRIGFSA